MNLYHLSHISGQLAVHLNIPKNKLSDPIRGVTFSYSQILEYLIYCHYEQSYPEFVDRINVFLKDSSREKVHYLLRALIDVSEKQPKIKEKYTEESLKSMINETILGFEEIEDCLGEFAQ